MACKVSNKDYLDILSRLESRNIVFPSQFETPQDISNFIDNMTMVLKEDNKFRYSIAGSSTGKSVTERLNKDYTGLPIYAETGTFIHSVLENILNNSTKSQTEMYNAAKTIFQGSAFNQTSDNIQDDIIKGLMNTAKCITTYAEKIQNRIDASKKPIIKMEKAIYSPSKDMPGSIDILIIYSDKTASILDLKTHPAEKMGEYYQFSSTGEYTGKKNYRSNFNDYNYQLSEYGKMLQEHYGILSIRSGRIIHLPMVLANQKSGNEYKVLPKIKAFYTPFNKTVRGDMMVVLPEKLKNENIDKWSKTMIDKIKASKSKAEQARLSEELDEVLVKHNFELLLKDIQVLIDDTKSALSNDVDITEVGDLMNNLIQSGKFINNLESYIQELFENNVAQERINNLQLMRLEVKNNIDNLSSKVLNYMSNKAIGVDVFNEHTGEYHADRYTGYYASMAKTLSGENNRWFQLLNTFKDEIDYNREKQLSKYFEEWRSYMKVVEEAKSRLGRKGFEDLMINPSTKNLYSRIKGDYYEDFNANKTNIKWLKVYRQVKPTFTKEQYAKQLKSFSEFISSTDRTEDEKKYVIKDWIKRHDVWNNNPEAWSNKSITEISEKAFEDYQSDEYTKIKANGLEELHQWYYKTMYKFLSDLGVNDKFSGNFIAEIRMDLMEKLNNSQLDENILQQIGSSFKAGLAIQPQNQHEYELSKTVPVYFLYPEGTKDYEKSRDFMLSMMHFAKMALNYKYVTQYQGAIEAVTEIFNSPQVKFRHSDRKGNAFNSNGEEIALVDNEQYKSIFNAYKNDFLYGHRPDMTDDRTLFTLEDGREITLYNTLKAFKNHTTVATLSFKTLSQVSSFAQGSLSKYIEGNKGVHFNKTDSQKSIKLLASDRNKSLALAGTIEIFSDDIISRYANEDNKIISLVDKTQYGLKKYVNSRAAMSGWRLESELRDVHLVNTLSMRYMYNTKEFNGIKKIHSFMLDANNNLKEEYINQGFITIRDGYEYNHDTGKYTIKGLNEAQTDKLVIAFRAAARQVKFGISGELTDNDKTILQQSIFGQFLLMYKTWIPGLVRERLGRTQYENITQTLRSGRYTEFKKFLISPTDELGGSVLFAEVAKRLMKFTAHLANPLNLIGNSSFVMKQDEQSLRLEFELWKNQNKDIYEQMSGTNEEKFLQFQQLRNGQLRALVAEIQIGISIMLLMGLISAGWNDDDEKNYMERKSFAILRKLNQEMTFMYNPIAITEMIKNPIPITTTFGQVTNSFLNGVDEIRDNMYGKDYKGMFWWSEEDKRDKTNLGHYSLGLAFPGFSGLATTFDLRDEDKVYGLK